MTTSIGGTTGVTFPDTSVQPIAAGSYTMGFKNRIINGAMIIAQRGTTAVTSNDLFPVDRFRLAFGNSSGAVSAQQNSSAPAGFINSIKYTTTTADASLGATEYAGFYHVVEGLNVADLAWGTASAATVTLSFWVRSSATGTFGGSLRNGAGTRSYPFSYTISAVDTWEQKSVTIAGDTSGTWLTTNGIGMYINLMAGTGSTLSGTAGAWASANYLSATGAGNLIATLNSTFYITGVQLEKGSTATSFDVRPYGTELALCQRYYYKVVTDTAAAKMLAPNGFADSTTTALCWTQFPVEMRASPTALEQTGTAANYQIRYTGGSSANCSSVPSFNTGATWGARSLFTVASGLTGGQAVAVQTAATAGIYLAWSAEL